MLRLILPSFLILLSITFAQQKQMYDLDNNSLGKTSSNTLDYNYMQAGTQKFEATLLKDGFFTIGTNNGTTNNILDNNCQITFGHPFAKTSYPSLIVDQTEYRLEEYFTELADVVVNNEEIKIINNNKQITSEFSITLNDVDNQIVIKYIIQNNDSISHSIKPKLVFDPSLGKYGDGYIPLSGAYLMHEMEFTTSDLPGAELSIVEKNTGAHGLSLGFDFADTQPEKINAVNWKSEEYKDILITDLYDLLLLFEWEEKEVTSNESYEVVLNINVQEPQFGQLFARLDMPSFLDQIEGISFPNEFMTYLQLFNSTNEDNFQVSISSSHPIAMPSNKSIQFNDQESMKFIEINTSSSIVYQDYVSDINITVESNGEVFEQISKRIFIPSTPLSDEGLIIVDDSIAVNGNNVEMFFEVHNETTGWPIGNLKKENIFLYHNDTGINDFALEKYSGGGSNLADIVFVLDVSGSMGDEIDQVRNNMNEFADSLLARGFDFRIGIVTFSTTVDDVWDFTDNVEEVKSNLARINLWGGIEDSPSALMRASELSFRDGSTRNIIWVTDEEYPEDNYTVEDVVERMLQLGITVHSIGLPSLQTTWSNPIIIPTGGNFYDINGNFRDVLLDVSRMEAQNKYHLTYSYDDNTQSNSNILLEIHYGLYGVKKNYTLNGMLPKVNNRTLSFYPNPFNPEIKFNISHKSFTDGQLRIYNVLGQCVKDISFRPNEINSLKWNAKNQTNSKVSSGFYIVNLLLKQNGSIVQNESAKILYLK